MCSVYWKGCEVYSSVDLAVNQYCMFYLKVNSSSRRAEDESREEEFPGKTETMVYVRGYESSPKTKYHADGRPADGTQQLLAAPHTHQNLGSTELTPDDDQVWAGTEVSLQVVPNGSCLRMRVQSNTCISFNIFSDLVKKEVERLCNSGCVWAKRVGKSIRSWQCDESQGNTFYGLKHLVLSAK